MEIVNSDSENLAFESKFNLESFLSHSDCIHRRLTPTLPHHAIICVSVYFSQSFEPTFGFTSWNLSSWRTLYKKNPTHWARKCGSSGPHKLQRTTDVNVGAVQVQNARNEAIWLFLCRRCCLFSASFDEIAIAKYTGISASGWSLINNGVWFSCIATLSLINSARHNYYCFNYIRLVSTNLWLFLSPHLPRPTPHQISRGSPP